MVAEALARMAAGGLDKVVLARALDVVADAPVDPVPMLRELARRDPRSYLFAVDLPSDRPGTPRTLLGASPELLLSRDGADVTANPLAGSAARAADPDEDRRRGEALLASAKDRHEHALVVADVAARLDPLVDDLEVPDEPALVATPTLWHLSTAVRGRAADPDVSALHLAQALHPTPAVCGVPRAAAHAAITEIEPFDRGFYTGAVGWTDARGDGEWVMALRCGEVAGDRVRLWAGAGIVPASCPADELAETAVKLRTLLDALGLDEA
jgi:isochorismate synthase